MNSRALRMAGIKCRDRAALNPVGLSVVDRLRTGNRASQANRPVGAPDYFFAGSFFTGPVESAGAFFFEPSSPIELSSSTNPP